ncbi:PAS and ANTAR domain-containing protein [Pseudarthrobacter sp. BRE9]|uniref:PAS and ANTAR domain-containing protein n=1 Tax=Pseudarthrobacter sp. BRE9 TaxID=2962582 RepID=UPI0028814AC8|nr:PAS and ANTAR domain-containing protein [Pseudarthrobacter sp. BRE9]MDT0168218.1 PAS and ANTAR domain-containing protein [Pseudarthrobacter sp. BRE9]
MTELSDLYTYSSALGDSESDAGIFRVEMGAAGPVFQWSDGMFRLHGYQRGEVVPSMELIFAHKHPDDRERCEEILAQVSGTGGFFCMYHRIVDARGRTRRVLTSGEAILGGDGSLAAIEGVTVDLSRTLQRETEQTAREAVVGATATRTVIDQARGILMGQLKLGSDDAFQMLVNTSSHRNVKLVVVAAELVQLANSPEARIYLDRAVRAIQLTGRADRAGGRRAG